MANLYSLTTEMQELYDRLEDTVDKETGEISEEISSALAVKQEEFNSKAISVATVARMFKAKAAEVAAEIERLEDIKKRYDTLVDKIYYNLSKACKCLGVVKIEGMHAAISFQKSERIVVDNLEDIPCEFKTIKTEVYADKRKIKEVIKNGGYVDGAHLEEHRNLIIR